MAVNAAGAGAISGRRRFASELATVPNVLTATRLLLIPVLWGFALAGRSVYVGVGLAVCFLTDFGDGFAARRLRQGTPFGSRFDSYVDALVAPSAIAWLLLLKREVLVAHWLLAATWLVVTYASLAVGLVRFRRVGNLHLYSSKIACVAQYAFLVDVFVSRSYSPELLYIAAGLGIVSSAETLALQLVRTRVDEHQGSLLALVRRTTA